MSLMRLVGRLFGPSTTDEQTYTCVCGAPMENTAIVTYDQYYVENWNCTDEECIRGGQAYFFEERPEENYGTGCLDGQVEP